MKCRYCGNELRSGERFCRKCGKPAEAEPVQSPRFCIECGAELLPNAGFCRSCGAPVSQQKPEQPQQPNAAQTDEKAELKRRTEILVIAAQGGDSESFAKLYKLYHQKVFALAKTTVKSDADAEDVLQTTFIKAWNHLDRLKDTSAFSTWIQRITLNQCYSLLRKQHATIPIDNDDEDSEPIQIESDLMLPEVYAEQNDLKKRLGKIIDELSDVQKQTITLYYFDGLPVENIAWIMDCSVNTVKSRLFLARKSIKTEIEEQERKSGQPFYGIVGLATIPFGQFFVAHVKASSLSQTAASALLKAIAGKISQSASAAAKAGSSAAVKAGTSAAAKGAANAGAKTAAAAGTKAAAGAGAKTAAAVGASVSKKVIAGIVAGTLAVGTVAGGTIAAIKIVEDSREKDAEGTSIVTEGTIPSVEASETFLPTDLQPVDSAPNGGLSAREREAYQAYLNVLTENRAGIDNYIWQKEYLEFDGNGNLIGLDDNTLTRSVALCDICGDELPELIYIGDADAGYFDDNGYYCNDLTLYLNILTIRDGRAVSVYRDFWGYGNDDQVIYHLFHVSGDKSLYAFEQIVDDYLGNTYLRFDEVADGTLTPVTVAYLYEDFEDDSPETDEECEYRDESGKRISKQEYQAIVSDLESRVDSVLMYSWLPDSALKNSCPAKTCGEMIAYLSGLLDATAENAYLAEPYRAYRNELTGNKTSIKSYQWYPDCFGVDLVQEPDHLQRAVVLHDLDRDGMPELLYICDQESDEFDIELRILSYRNGKAEPVYTDKSLVGELGNYAYFQLRGDSDLYCNYREDDVYRDLTGTYSMLYLNDYYKLDFTSSDGWSDPFLSDNEDNIGTSHTYLSDGQKIDRATFEAIERELLAQKEICLMQGWRFKDRSRCPAMTYDEQLAYLNAFLYAVPAQAPASEAPASDADLYAAYSAYLDALLENKDGIDRYIWQLADWYDFYEESDDNAGGFVRYYPENFTYNGRDYPLPPQPVALYDLNGDTVPELIYIDVKDQNPTFHSESTLHVLSFRNNQLISLYSGKYDIPDTEEWRMQLSLSILPDGTLYRFEGNGSTFDGEDQYDIYAPDVEGMLHRTMVLRYTLHEDDDDDSPLYETYLGTGNQIISKDEYNEQLKRFNDSILLFSWEGNGDLAMTCDEAIAWLKSQLGQQTSTRTPEWIDAYRQFIIKEQYLTLSPDDFDDEEPIRFALFDMDRSGVPELIIFTGHGYHAASYCMVYSYLNGKIREIGSIGCGWWDFYCGVFYFKNREFPGLLFTDAGGGYEWTEYYTVVNNQVTDETIAEAYEGSETTALTDNDALFRAYVSNSFEELKMYTYEELMKLDWTAYAKSAVR